MTNLSTIRMPSFGGSIDQVWDQFFETSPTYNSNRRGLSYQIKSEDDAVVAEVEVPGVNPKDVAVRVEGRAVHVETPRGNAYFTIGSRVDIDHVTATIHHGLLSLRVPKREARTVEVKVEVEGQES
jgi:HSP20 family molecular chaperone IbpA